ncbi:MAG: B12-binding domain-containing radical SAM protein [Magnetospiraceae bacterium]
MMYDMPLYRPPSEGRNLIIQATLGCSFDGCTFCSMYKVKDYRARPLDQVFADIDQAAAHYPGADRIFIADGDALGLPMDHWRPLLARLRETFPHLTRVSSYATPSNLLRKTADELAELRAGGLRLLYVGIESGSKNILRRIRKGATPDSMTRALNAAAEAGFKVSATVILGLGGQTFWEDHIDGTIALMARAPVTYLSTLQLTLAPEVAPRFLEKFEAPFTLQEDAAILEEQARLIAGIDPPKPIIFRSNHASNALALAGNLPKDRNRLLSEIAWAREDGRALRPQWLRGL